MNVGTELNKRGLSNEELTSSTFNYYPLFWEREIEFTRRNGFLEIPDHTPRLIPLSQVHAIWKLCMDRPDPRDFERDSSV